MLELPSSAVKTPSTERSRFGIEEHVPAWPQRARFIDANRRFVS